LQIPIGLSRSPRNPFSPALVDRIVYSDIEIITQFQDHHHPHPNELVRTHALCDSLSQWADPTDAAAFFTSANPASWLRLLDLSLVKLTMHFSEIFDSLQNTHLPNHDDDGGDDFIKRFYQTELCKQKFMVMNQLQSCCNGCNSASCCGEAGHSKNINAWHSGALFARGRVPPVTLHLVSEVAECSLGASPRRAPCPIVRPENIPANRLCAHHHCKAGYPIGQRLLCRPSLCAACRFPHLIRRRTSSRSML
jgi:hypothetical protein